MKTAITTLNTILIFSLLITMGAGNGQTKRNIAPNTTKHQETTIAGEPKITLPEGVSPQTMFRCSMKDIHGNLWFGTTGAGIYKYDGKLFTRYAEKQGLSSSFVVGIAQDIKGNIWVATDNDLFHSNGDTFRRLEIPALDGLKIGFGNNISSTKKFQVFCVLGDKKGNMWFGTEHDGLWKYDGTALTNFKYNGSNWLKVLKNDTQNYNGFVSAILEDKNGNIYFSSSATGLTRYNGASFQVLNLAHSNHHVLQMMEDKSGNIWMATRLDGVCRFNGKTIESFTEKEGVYDNMASCLYETKNGHIWFGSLGKAGTGGTGVKGMSNNQVWTVVEDNTGNIWVGTKAFGLFRYDGKSFTEFTTK